MPLCYLFCLAIYIHALNSAQSSGKKKIMIIIGHVTNSKESLSILCFIIKGKGSSENNFILKSGEQSI